MTGEQHAVNAIKTLGMDAVQQANSGHPGMVMGMADIAAVLWGDFVRYDPSDASWHDRDRVILSNGHGSMLLYSILHLTGQSLTMDDLKNFRQWGSPTAGHPEYGYAPGIETTTGPLGQGFANGVGMAMAERWLREHFGQSLTDHYTYVLCGDGCLMEGVSAEAASLAGHLKLEKLIVLYDANDITIDGNTNLTFSEQVGIRFQSYGWNVSHIDGHDRDVIRDTIKAARNGNGKPTLICCKTVIAHGAPTKAGSNKAHGAPLGEEEIRGAKEALGVNPDEKFTVSDAAYTYFQNIHSELQKTRTDWDQRLVESQNKDEYLRCFAEPDSSLVEWPIFEKGSAIATRSAGGKIIQAVAKAIPNLIGGSADLAGSNKTTISGSAHLSGDSFLGRNIHFGVREHAMAAICNGMSLHGGVDPFCATFLVFHDYMRPSVRLASLMHQPVKFIYTHDSIFVGEDGPTHQPIEQVESMRLIPGLWVLRPADAMETVEMWKVMLDRRDGPCAICLTRQNLPVLEGDVSGARFGGYVYKDFVENGSKKFIIVATGSEVSLALEAVDKIIEDGFDVRIVSMPCRELFAQQSAEYKESVFARGVLSTSNSRIKVISIEAGVTQGWTGSSVDAAIGLDRFGASAPGKVVANKLGLNVKNIVEHISVLSLDNT
jgi:transketolase